MNRIRSGLRRRVSTLKAKFLLRQHGVAPPAGLVAYGTPIIDFAAGATVTIGQNVVMCSSPKDTALGVSRPTTLRALRPSARLWIGSDVGFSGTVICVSHEISIGDRCLFGADVVVVDTDFHEVHAVPRRYLPLPASKPAHATHVGHDVFVGARSLILKGVTIGDGAVVGAGSVVTRDVPSGAIVAGNPAREIGRVQRAYRGPDS